MKRMIRKYNLGWKMLMAVFFVLLLSTFTNSLVNVAHAVDEERIVNFTLINADSDQPVPGFETLLDHATVALNLAALPTPRLNIRANTNPTTVGSVLFTYDGRNFPPENVQPYALAGDSPVGNYKPWTPAVGRHTVIATPYTQREAGGIAGVSATITLLVSVGCARDTDCDDGNMCNGSEQCLNGQCLAGRPLVCDNRQYCDGTETCDPTRGCVSGPLPCFDRRCDEDQDRCVICVTNDHCDDGTICNGMETCVNNECSSGTPLRCDDGNLCNGREGCDSVEGCQPGTFPLRCDDGNFCNGEESCDPIRGCQVGVNPCGDYRCDEVQDQCISGCQSNADCDNGNVCDGLETCGAGVCKPGTPITCNPGQICDETNGQCICNNTEPGLEITCGDSFDNDCDGAVDSQDSDCAAPSGPITRIAMVDSTGGVPDPRIDWLTDGYTLNLVQYPDKTFNIRVDVTNDVSRVRVQLFKNPGPNQQTVYDHEEGAWPFALWSDRGCSQPNRGCNVDNDIDFKNWGETLVPPLPPTPEAGNYQFCATPNGNESQKVCRMFSITQGSSAPVAEAGDNQVHMLPRGVSSMEVILNGSGRDPDGGEVSFHWSGNPQPEPSASAQARVTLEARIEPYVFTLEVTDDEGVRSTDTVAVTINPYVSQPPVAIARANQTTFYVPQDGSDDNRLFTVRLDGSQSQGEGLRYRWEGNPDPPDQAISEVVISGVQNSPFTFTLTVTDVFGVSDTATPVVVRIERFTPPTGRVIYVDGWLNFSNTQGEADRYCRGMTSFPDVCVQVKYSQDSISLFGGDTCDELEGSGSGDCCYRPYGVFFDIFGNPLPSLCHAKRNLRAMCNNYSIAGRNCTSNDGLGVLRIQDAAMLAPQPGDTIYIREGVYTENAIRFANGGMPGAPITIMGYPLDATRPIIQTANQPGNWNIFQFDTIAQSDGKSNYVIKNLKLQNARAGIAVWGDRVSQEVRMTDVRLEDLEISNVGTGISVSKGGSVDRMLIQNVVIHHTSGTEGGLEFGSNGVACEAGTGARNVIIRNSISFDNYHRQASGFIVQETSKNIVWINNKGYDNGEQCIASKAGGHNIYLGNYCYDNPAASYYLHGPRKQFSCGLVNGEMSNYLLLNNVGLNTVDSESNQARFRMAQPVAKIFLYHNTGVAMKKRPPCFGQGACPINNAVLASLIMNPTEDFLVPGEHRYIYSFNNLYYQAQNWSGDPPIKMAPDTAQNRIFFTSEGDWTGTGDGRRPAGFANLNPDDSSIPQDLRLVAESPAIGHGISMDLSNPMHYANQIEEFLTAYSPDGDANHAFEVFAIMTSQEKQELRDYIRNVYRYDADGNPRDARPDSGAYEYASGCQNGTQRDCPLASVVGSVCAGVQQICENGQWLACDYGPNYEQGEEVSCGDGLDNDCNGRADIADQQCQTTINKDLGNIGTFHKWHKIEKVFTGPNTSAAGSPNPFEIPVTVTFTPPQGQPINLPAFYDGDGNGGASGNVWKFRFSADQIGSWSFTIASTDPDLNGYHGTFTIDAVPTDAPNFFKWGRLEYANGHYLKFADGNYWIKSGTDDPENFLAQSNKIEMVNYFRDRGVNSIYVITDNLGGDHSDTWPWLGTGGDKTRFDVARLAEWETFFDYVQRQGIALHIMLEDDDAPTLNDDQHRAYYRELVARFGYLPAIIWNMKEEANLGAYDSNAQVRIAGLMEAVDKYNHPYTVHSKLTSTTAIWPHMENNNFDLASIEFGEGGSRVSDSNVRNVYQVITNNRKASEIAGRPIPITIDELPYVGSASDRFIERSRVFYPIFLSGGQYELHYQGASYNQLTDIWNDLRRAREFVESLPFNEMNPCTNLLSPNTDNMCFGKGGEAYGIYLKNGGSVTLDLTGASETFRVSWYNVTNGQYADGGTMTGGGSRLLVSLLSGDVAVKLIREGTSRSGGQKPNPPPEKRLPVEIF